MRKNEKYIYNSQFCAVYSSTIAQYTDTNSNTTFLFYATREKNHLYFSRQSMPIQYVNVKIGQVEMNNLLPVNNGSEVFIDISDAIESLTNVTDMVIAVRTPAFTTTLNFRLVPLIGYNYDNLARILSVAQGNYCYLYPLAKYNYDRQSTHSNIAPPTKIIVPYANGVRMFSNVSSLALPCYNSTYGISNVEIVQGETRIAYASNNRSTLLTFTINNLQGLYGAYLRITDYTRNNIILEDFNPAKKYVAVRWANPYTSNVSVGLQGEGAPYFDMLPIKAVTFFELAEYEEEQQVTSLESTGSEMPYLINSGQKCTLRMTNLNAYDYIYYSQILKSESIEILFDTLLTESNYQPVKLEKSKITLPTSGTGLYNLEFTVIISEND